MPQSNELESAAAQPPYDAVLAAIRHGTHVCAFYETEEDLLDLVGQFFAATGSWETVRQLERLKPGLRKAVHNRGLAAVVIRDWQLNRG